MLEQKTFFINKATDVQEKYNTLKLMLYTLIFQLIALPLICQLTNNSNDNHWQLSTGPVFGSQDLIDYHFSAVPFIGFSYGAYALLKYQPSKSSHELELGFNNANLRLKMPANVAAKSSCISFGYSNLYKLKKEMQGSLQYEAGGGINFVYRKRTFDDFINNDNSFEMIASLNAVFRLSYRFKNKQNGISVSEKILLPFISAIVQPAYGTGDPANYINHNSSSLNAYIKSSRLASFSSYQRINSILSLQKEISNRSAISLGYAWDYFQVNDLRKVKQVTHNILVTYSYFIP